MDDKIKSIQKDTMKVVSKQKKLLKEDVKRDKECAMAKQMKKGKK